MHLKLAIPYEGSAFPPRHRVARRFVGTVDVVLNIPSPPADEVRPAFEVQRTRTGGGKFLVGETIAHAGKNWMALDLPSPLDGPLANQMLASLFGVQPYLLTNTAEHLSESAIADWKPDMRWGDTKKKAIDMVTAESAKLVEHHGKLFVAGVEPIYHLVATDDPDPIWRLQVEDSTAVAGYSKDEWFRADQAEEANAALAAKAAHRKIQPKIKIVEADTAALNLNG
jgi:hypothetical protein